MIVLAGAFLTFVGFLFAGLLAIAATVVLDKSLGKEKALLLFSGVLFLFTLWQCTPEKVGSGHASASTDRVVASQILDPSGDPLARPSLGLGPDARNPFQKHSDTHGLPPVTLDDPPWLPLSFSLPPTIPGPAPGARYLLRGPLPELKVDDGSSIPEIQDPHFQDYQPVAADVYDIAVDSSGRKVYVYIKGIKDGGTLYREDDAHFQPLKWELARHAPGWEDLEVEWALVGGEETASKALTPTDVIKKRRENVSTSSAKRFDEWVLRSTVDNLYAEALRRHGLSADLSQSTDISALRQAAEEMAATGKTGKEDRAGWRRAVDLLERALTVARERGVPALRADILLELVHAYSALQDEEAVLHTLSEYARVSPTRPEPWLWLGQLYLDRLSLPAEAVPYFRAALDRGRNADASIGLGDALAALGRHDEAVAAYRQAAPDPRAQVRTAEALLRLGDLAGAGSAFEGAASAGTSPRALLVKGAISYAKGDLQAARDAFLGAATSTGEEALTYRAQALYDLGLACWRMGQGGAARAAFTAAERALSFGAAPRRFADESVSPAFGFALIALATGNAGELLASLQRAKEEAPGVAYHDYLAGWVAQRDGNTAVAVRSFGRALGEAQVYPELDGWLARSRLDVAIQALAAGTPLEETSKDFDAAVAFAERASSTEAKRDPKAFRSELRECWIKLHDARQPARHRFTAAGAVADHVLQKIDAEQPGALALRAYCDYQIGEYDDCIRHFQLVKDKVPEGDEGEWRPWRDYASDTLEAVKHWRSLEEKVVTFDGTSLPAGWEQAESHGVRARVEDEKVEIEGVAKDDGTYDDPTVAVFGADDLMTVGTMEDVRVRVRIRSATIAARA